MGWWTTAVIVLTLVQVGLGTQVREQVDDALAIVPRDQALAQVGALDTTHRELAAIAALAVVALWARIWTGYAADGALRRAVNLALACTGAQVAAGVLPDGRAAAGSAGAPPHAGQPDARRPDCHRVHRLALDAAR